jgi:hypothetical protein
MTRAFSRSAFLPLLAFILSACGGTVATVLVSYEGTFLFVHGTSYERPADIRQCEGGICTGASNRASYAAGQILLQYEPGRAQDIANLVAGYGLTIIGNFGPETTFTLIISVPVLSEEQWVQAFRREPIVRRAWTNDVVRASMPSLRNT